jgi:histidine triad (HIT) family protein
MNDCLFCNIVSGKAPAAIVFQDDQVTAFRDIHPQAPTHILIVPNTHVAGAAQLTPGHAALLAAMFTTANHLAKSEAIAQAGYRLVINQGAGAGQSVFHLHLHLLGGRGLGWPPG